MGHKPGKPIAGRRAWSYATWARYVGAGKSPVEVRRRLELAKQEAPNGATAEVEEAAERKLAVLEDREPHAELVRERSDPAADGDSITTEWWTW